MPLPVRLTDSFEILSVTTNIGSFALVCCLAHIIGFMSAEILNSAPPLVEEIAVKVTTAELFQEK